MPKRSISKFKIKKLKEQILDGMNNNLGIVTPVLKQVGISFNTYKKWLSEDETFKNDVESIDVATIEWVASKLYENIKNNDKTSIIYFLKSKGKKFGWAERTEINQTTKFEEPIKLNIILPEQKRIDSNEPKKLNK